MCDQIASVYAAQRNVQKLRGLAKTEDMTSPIRIYIILAAFFAFGIAVDWIVWDGLPPSWTWNDITQMIGVIVLCLMWESADAMQRDKSHRGSARLLTILLPPLGTLVYFFQTRRWPQAIAAEVLFWGGLVAVAFVTDEFCYRLLA